MLSNHLINYYILKELICQDKYKKMKLKLNDENANIANLV